VADLHPRVTARDLPPEVVKLREARAVQEQELDEHWEPRIQAHIAALTTEVERVIEMHRHVADLTDLELDADTRWSAIWLLSGRCLAICRVVLHDLRARLLEHGFGAAADVTAAQPEAAA